MDLYQQFFRKKAKLTKLVVNIFRLRLIFIIRTQPNAI